LSAWWGPQWSQASEGASGQVVLAGTDTGQAGAGLDGVVEEVTATRGRRQAVPRGCRGVELPPGRDLGR
jgi:hypothetical protein